MTFKTIDNSDVAHFVSIAIGIEYVLTDSESIDAYSHDETEDLKYFPEVVLNPILLSRWLLLCCTAANI